MRAWAVVDLGFGDGGKGLFTDFLVRTTGATAVVRFNGGPQAGHTVVCPDARKHTFASFGAGSFVPGVATYLSRFVALHPTAMAVEAKVLADKGVTDVMARTFVHEQCPVITPFHQATNRLRELARGASRHGSCGVGHGELVADTLERLDSVVHAIELWRATRALRSKLLRLQDAKRTQAKEFGADESSEDWRVLDDLGVVDRWLEATRAVTNRCALFEALPAVATVFEGAQGVLLDERAGFSPHTTWSNCTFENAAALWAEVAPLEPLSRLGVCRSHMVRHGPGPLPTETRVLDGHIAHESNIANRWQGPVRYGWFDAGLLRKSLALCGPVDALAVTHADLSRRTRLHWVDAKGSMHAVDGALEVVLSEALDRPVTHLSHGPSSRDIAILRSSSG